mmetsp:Transcript_130655/g.244427  ORF Transcript_130655/g.244427 Transcript_130655/m.244427 type:complete len:170 (+) Transcript_130655:40-549(+)
MYKVFHSERRADRKIGLSFRSTISEHILSNMSPSAGIAAASDAAAAPCVMFMGAACDEAAGAEEADDAAAMPRVMMIGAGADSSSDAAAMARVLFMGAGSDEDCDAAGVPCVIFAKDAEDDDGIIKGCCPSALADWSGSRVWGPTSSDANAASADDSTSAVATESGRAA